MFEVIGLDHIVLNTSNVEKMISFYVESLGCSISKVNEKLKLTHIKAGDTLIDLMEIDASDNMTRGNMNHFCLRISPFSREELISHFNQHNIEIEEHGMRYGAQGDGYSIYVKDPDGNVVELKELIT